jgi:hypothetical protein
LPNIWGNLLTLEDLKLKLSTSSRIKYGKNSKGGRKNTSHLQAGVSLLKLLLRLFLVTSWVSFLSLRRFVIKWKVW